MRRSESTREADNHRPRSSSSSSSSSSCTTFTCIRITSFILLGPIALLLRLGELRWDISSLGSFQIMATVKTENLSSLCSSITSLYDANDDELLPYSVASNNVRSRSRSSPSRNKVGATPYQINSSSSSSSSSSYDPSPQVLEVIQAHPECQGKERLVEILIKAGKKTKENFKSDCEILPTWDQVSALYGDEPIVHGLETCASYRASLRKTNTAPTSRETNNSTSSSSASSSSFYWEPDPRIAGLYSMGTNAFADSLRLNFRHVTSLDQYNLLGGGKHASLRSRPWKQNKLPNKGPFLPIILIRDPFRWMLSMCGASYKTIWKRGSFRRCPNLVPSAYERRARPDLYPHNMSTFATRVDRGSLPTEYYDSLADMWSDWYLQYFHVDFPRLIIRYEDTIFHADKVMELIMDCVGRPMKEPFKYPLEPSRVHGKNCSGFVTALAKCGSDSGRFNGLLPEDRKYARSALDATLMQTFHYTQPPLRLDPDYRLEEEQVSGLEIRFDSCKGKKRILGILLRTGLGQIAEYMCDRLPTASEISSTYGSKPVVIGLDTCERYRNSVKKEFRDARIDGLQNSGKNDFAASFAMNYWQHEPVDTWKMRKGIQKPARANETLPYLPIILVRDPFLWMISMCERYGNTYWDRGWMGRCPNLVPSEFEQQLQHGKFSKFDTFQVTVDRNGMSDERYETLADMWSTWYRQIMDTSNPRLIVRLEDTLLHADKVMQQVSECLGKPMVKPFRYRHNYGYDIADYLEPYVKGRYKGLTAEDRLYARKALDPKLMEVLQYAQVPVDDDIDAQNEQFSGFETKFSTCADKKKLLGILHRAGKTHLTDDDCQALPSWSDVSSLYGEEPVVVGLEKCEEYRSVMAAKAVAETEIDCRFPETDFHVTGLPHTGTSVFSKAIDINVREGEAGGSKQKNTTSQERCYRPSEENMLLRERSWYMEREDNNKSELLFLPIVLVRDPYTWMQSMCQDPYKAEWRRGAFGRCPNLVPSPSERRVPKFQNMTTFKVTVHQEREDRYDSLVDMWTEWHHSFFHADFPRLMIRFEDTLFHAEKVMDLVTQCITGQPIGKAHKYYYPWTNQSDLAALLQKYGTEDGRYSHLTEEDHAYARKAIGPVLMNLFHYKRRAKCKRTENCFD